MDSSGFQTREPDLVTTFEMVRVQRQRVCYLIPSVYRRFAVLFFRFISCLFPELASSPEPDVKDVF